MGRREEILKNAIKAFAKFGLMKTTLEDIARECGLTKPALYYYFRNKDEIIQELIDSQLKDLQTKALSALAESDLPAEQLKRYMTMRLEHFMEKRYYADRILADWDEVPYKYKALLGSAEEKLARVDIEVIKGIIQKSIDSGEIKNVSVDNLSLMLIGMLLGFGHYIVDDKRDIDIEKEVDFSLNLIYNGLKK